MCWDSLLKGEKDSSQKGIHTILGRIYGHIDEILAIVKEDRASLDEIADRVLSLEERITALENREKQGKQGKRSF
jgi:hypothetical protein